MPLVPVRCPFPLIVFFSILRLILVASVVKLLASGTLDMLILVFAMLPDHGRALPTGLLADLNDSCPTGCGSPSMEAAAFPMSNDLRGS
ncbi:hypothetical protein T4C_12029 [Trichinella pseudospiralis]|uniref:Uncharacterized protein n=1 Tax=Trichinella pseudospiralis TaxID=6337 RepID=A0A0V1K2U7_TRIPS|nr:hypothetical protein T4C_12029 [Trichinella pseudospiralis]